MALAKRCLSPPIVWHGPLFRASAASPGKAKINSPHSLALPWFIIYIYYSVVHFKIAVSPVGTLPTRTSGISRGRHNKKQWLFHLVFLTSTHQYKIIFISRTCTHICEIHRNIHKLNQENHEIILCCPLMHPEILIPALFSLKSK